MGLERTPARKKKEARWRRAQEEYWSSMNGPVVVRSKVVAPPESGAVRQARGSGTTNQDRT